MENRNDQSQNQDFTSKGRTSNANEQGGGSEPVSDISNVDQQEGEMNHGTTGADQHLFASEKKRTDAAADE